MTTETNTARDLIAQLYISMLIAEQKVDAEHWTAMQASNPKYFTDEVVASRKADYLDVKKLEKMSTEEIYLLSHEDRGEFCSAADERSPGNRLINYMTDLRESSYGIAQARVPARYPFKFVTMVSEGDDAERFEGDCGEQDIVRLVGVLNKDAKLPRHFDLNNTEKAMDIYTTLITEGVLFFNFRGWYTSYDGLEWDNPNGYAALEDLEKALHYPVIAPVVQFVPKDKTVKSKRSKK